MVSYGNSEFREWAEEMGVDDNDLMLMKKEVDKHKWIWLLNWLLCFLMYPGQSGALNSVLANICTVIGSISVLVFWLFGCSFLCKCINLSRTIKYGTMNPKTGLVGTIFGLINFCTWLSIIPLIITLISRKRLWGTGINKLVKKGLIGNH